MLKFLKGNWKHLLGLSTTMALFALAILNPALTTLISGVVIGGATPFAFLTQWSALASAALVAVTAGLSAFSAVSLLALTAGLFSGKKPVAAAATPAAVAVVEPEPKETQDNVAASVVATSPAHRDEVEVEVKVPARNLGSTPASPRFFAEAKDAEPSEEQSEAATAAPASPRQ